MFVQIVRDTLKTALGKLWEQIFEQVYEYALEVQAADNNSVNDAVVKASVLRCMESQVLQGTKCNISGLKE